MSPLLTVARRVVAVFAVAVLTVGLSASGAWGSTLFSKVPGEMAEGRYAPAAVLLPNGTVLVAGGYILTGKPLKTAEVFNPASGMFQKLAGELNEPRGELAFAALVNGKVLLAGGYNFSPTGHSLKTAELFDPETNTFLKLSAEMAVGRDGPVASLLPNGKVLVTGGETEPGKPLKSAELFNPATNTFEKIAGEASLGRYQPVAVTLPNGKVLVAGGLGEGSVTLKSAELFNPEMNTFEALIGATHELTEAREEFAAALLQNGRVLLIGGLNAGGKGLKTAELFNAETNTFEKLSTELTEPREGPAAALIPNGQVLIVGGYNPTLEPEAARYLKTAELTSVAPPTATTTPATALGIATATLNGTVLTEAAGMVYFQYGTSAAYGASTAHQHVGGSAGPQPIAATVSALMPGMVYHFRVVAENVGGPSFGVDETFTTAAVASVTPPAINAPTQPVVSYASQSHARWRRGNNLAKITKTRPPVGTVFSFSLNEQAGVSFLFTQQVGGRKVSGKCVAQTKPNQRRRSCKRTVNRAAMTFNGHQGLNNVAFQGRVSRSKTLGLGTYTLVITATNTAGQRSSPKQLAFTIVK